MPKAKQLLREGHNIVADMVEGMALSHPHLVLEPSERVLLHRDYVAIRERQVTLISGGGSGHEPAHAGYIGEGMLTAVVCGGVFASPSTQQVLTAIRLAAGPHGCLVVVKNYTGDRLNFGLAVEQAKAEGLKCDMVVVGEDVAVVNANAGRRGLSGTVFVHKLAGAAAKMGKDLATLVKMVNGLITESKLGTMGVAIKPCTLPGKEDTSREWGDNEMEVGLGIHGEPGVAKCEQQDVPSLCRMLVDKISDQTSVGLGLKQGSKAVLMVSNLGSTTNMELYVVAKYAVEALQAKGIEPERVMVGSFMTALDMAGFSLSLWNSNGDAEMLALFDAPTSAPAWTYSPFDLSQSTLSGSFIKAEAPAQTQKTFQRPAELSNKGLLLEKCILAVCETLIKNEPQLTNWDTKVGDGDCGTTFKNAAEAILVDLKAHYPLNDATQTLRALADSVGRSAGGTSGVLYVIFLTAGSLHLESCKEADTAAWVGAFRAGISAIQKYGGATEGSRTMVDALVPSLRALDNQASKTGAELATAAAKAAQEGADATAHMSTKQAFGRAGYVGEEFGAGIPDPGAKAAAFWIQAIADTLNSS
ncbi:putative 3,4-dihydroxy-2-butanone kinase [Phytophthora idaei]|nr:putative 3,4-dihydroxy-2-butanone kinase [Phytophthora idaei]KAG3161025.1 putative 3,4-dihydroxy-2-butanone kinase [Phytophthora idaei]KAG3248040.1 putative 3,4-dihydroxy-2-butanone kinase [Phytophthora idaei]